MMEVQSNSKDFPICTLFYETQADLLEIRECSSK